MSKLFKHLQSEEQIALEMIDFQHDSYAQDVEVLFAVLMTDLKKDPAIYRTLNKHPSVKQIEEITFKRTGVKVGLVVNGFIGLVLPFHPNEYSVLLNEDLRGSVYSANDYAKLAYSQEYKLIESALEKKGTVDTKKCKVSGIFSEYKNPIHINVRTLMGYKMTSGEITSVFLHELGHAFYSFEYSNRMNRTNQILADLLRKTTSKKAVNKEYLFKELKIINPKTTNEELDKIFSGSNIVLGLDTLKYLKETVESQLPSDYYNDNVFETLADNFAARWGYGEQLVTGLDKIQDKSIFNSNQSKMGLVIASISSIFLIIMTCILFIKLVAATLVLTATAAAMGGASVSFVATVGVMATYTVGVLVASFVFWHSSYAQPMTYDDLKYRYKRVRNQLIEILKDIDLPTNQTKETIEQIKRLDVIIDQTHNYKNIVTIIMDFLTPGHGTAQDGMKMQRLLEDLSASDLYLQAASLRTNHN